MLSLIPFMVNFTVVIWVLYYGLALLINKYSTSTLNKPMLVSIIGSILLSVISAWGFEGLIYLCTNNPEYMKLYTCRYDALHYFITVFGGVVVLCTTVMIRIHRAIKELRGG